MTSELQVITSGHLHLDGFIHRALVDFALNQAFEIRSIEERAGCLHWISEANAKNEKTSRVSDLLDALDAGEPLPPAK